MKQPFRLTETGIGELKTELDKLVASRVSIAEAISIAREQGDLSENAEYQAAKQDQDRVEARIKEIENILKNTSVIKQPGTTNVVQLGSRVELEEIDGGDKTTFSIVGTVEADPFQGKLSDESPIGRALMGCNLGEIVELAKNGQQLKYKIRAIK